MTREEAIKALQLNDIEFGGKSRRLAQFFEALDMAIEALEKQSVPEINVGNKWIPCIDEMPKTNGVYQITRKIQDGDSIHYIPSSAYFDGINTWHDDTRVNHNRPYLKNVIAWKPLSEPYKEG